jgi:DNA-binding MarR family transcriptional regulator
MTPIDLGLLYHLISNHYRRASGEVSCAAITGKPVTLSTSNDVLIAVRKIIRATDLHSRHLARTAGLTTPQLMVLQAIDTLGTVAIARLAEAVSLSQATVTTIIDRLEQRGLVERRRSPEDRRVVNAYLTESGGALLASAPAPLQDTFTRRFEQLADWEQTLILSALQRVASMMGAAELDAAPILDIGELDRGNRQH